MIYWSSGRLIDSKKVLPVKKFQVHDVITILVDIKEGLIQWKLNNTTIKKIHPDNLLDKTKDWIPYIHFHGPNSILIS